MSFEIHPATAARFEDVRAVLGPKRPGAQGCWCLSVRLGAEEASRLEGEQRADLVRDLGRRRGRPPGVLAYDGQDVVGWAGTSAWAEIHEFTHGRRYPGLERTDDLWVVWCFRVVAGQGRRGIATRLVEGVADYARRRGASGIVGYPVDNAGGKVDRTLASVGTRAMFEQNGFSHVGDVDGKRGGYRQVVMRRDFP